jgi:AraC-like DNA-binding protein
MSKLLWRATSGDLQCRSVARVTGSIATLVFRQLLDTLADLGVDRDRVLGLAGLSRDRLDEPSGRLPAEVSFAFWDAAIAVSGDPAIGLRVGAHVPVGALGSYEYLLRNSETVRKIVDRADRYMKLVDDTCHLELVERDGLVALKMVRTGGYVFPRSDVEALFAAVREVVRRELQQDHPVAVELAYPPPTDPAIYAAHFGCPVAFDSESHALWFPAAILHTRARHADPQLGCVLEQHTEHLLAQLPDDDPFVLDVRGKIVDAIKRGRRPTPAMLAKAMHTSQRSLRRRLAEQRTSYQLLLGEVRAELARHYVAQTRTTFDSIAERLSFADASAFYRAFKRWTGTTPAEFRRARGA